MMYSDKVEVIKECIDLLRKPIDNEEGDYEFLDYKDSYRTLEQFKAEVEALALQEAEKYAKETAQERKEIKKGKHLDNEVRRENITDVTPKHMIKDVDQWDEYRMSRNID